MPSALWKPAASRPPGSAAGASDRDERTLRGLAYFLTLAVAGWCRYLRGTDESGRVLELDDPRALELRRLARAGGTDPAPLLSSGLFGALADDEQWTAELAAALERVERDGVVGALAALLDDARLVA